MIAPHSPSGNSNTENPAAKPTSDVAETNVNTLDNVDSQTTNVHAPVHCESAPNELAPNASHCLTSRNSDTPPTAETSRPPTVPDMIPVRMLNEFAYCPRLGYLEFVHAEWEDNFETKNGTFGHRRVDKADRKNIQSPIHNDQNNSVPNNTTPNNTPNNTSDQRERVGDSNSPTSTDCPTPPPAEASRPDQAARLHARSILLSAPDEGLIAKLDVMELEGRKATPVDYKRGQAPTVDEGAWEPERVQLCAQGLILRENGFECDEGILYFIGSKKRVVIPFTDELIARTRQLRTDFTETASANITPPPLVDSPKCPRCSLVGICLPDELVYLNAQASQQTASPPQNDTAPNSTDYDTSPPTTSAIQPAVRKLLPARDDWTPFYVQEFGAMLGKSGDRLQVKKRGEVIGERRLKDVSQVSLFGSVIVSAQALSELTARGISICHFSHGGWFQGITTGLVHKNVELRIRQYQTALQPEAAVRIARQFISGKIRNCRTLLRRHLSAEHKPLLQKLERYRRSAEQTTSLESLLGIEGMAAKEYFSGLFELMRNRHDFDVNDRNRRPPKDPVNAVLSFAYSLLTKELTIVLQSVGFDPMLGMLHQPRYGRPSLALDVAEEYRPLIADSVMLTAFNNGELSSDRFLERAGAVVLTAAGRAAVIAAFERRMNTEITHPIFGYRISYRRILEVQCRLLARTLLGEIDQYPAFCTR